MNIVENNYLIADFMELNLDYVYKEGYVAHVVQEGEHEGKTFLTDAELAKYLRSLSEDGEPELSDDFLVEEAHSQGYVGHVACPPYHSSWDWLIPVVAKMYQVVNGDFKTVPTKVVFRFEEIQRCTLLNEIESAHSVVVKLIKWYNENNSYE